MPEVKPNIETFANIKVIGVGGGGGSAISRMIESQIKGVDFVAINTDAQDLHHSPAAKKIYIGKNSTKGLGAGMNPDMGRRAAEENQDDIGEAIDSADMVFITCGLGGGTGSGASPIVANVAKEAGALTVAVVTKPFSFEGAQRSNIAGKALVDLESKVDSIIVIPNDRILQLVDKKTSLLDSFKTVDRILQQGIQGIAEIITISGLINVDFADVKAIMKDSGTALMGIGSASGESRAVVAAKEAITSPLLETSIDGAQGVLFCVTGSPDLTMHEVNESAKVITQSVDPEAKIIFGAVIDENLKDEIKITVIATGFEKGKKTISKEKHLFRPQQQNHFYEKGNNFNYSQKKEEEPEVSEVKHEEPSVQEDDELEIPAFLRKKVD